jgi:uncharacterized protein
VRLVELERHVLDPAKLGWTREDDVPSSLIPQFYFDYLRGGPASPLAGVVRHNQMDLRGLAALFCKINTMLSESSESGDIESLDLFGLSRFLQRRGEPDRAQSACAQALSAGLPAEFRPQARRDLALHAKRSGNHARAAELWHEIAGDPRDGVYACEQLAIYYERRAKDYAHALEFAQLALAKLRKIRGTLRDPFALARFTRLEGELLKRVGRLQHRMGIVSSVDLQRRFLTSPSPI